MEEKETETRSLTLTKDTWKKIDSLLKKYTVINAQEVIRRYIDTMLKIESE